MALSPKVNNVDRALIQAPVEDMSFEEEDLQAQQDMFFDGEVEIVEDDDGGVEITTGMEEVVFGEEPENFYDNLAENLQESTLGEVASYVTSSVEEDKNSRSEWEDTYVKGLDLLGMRYETRTEPFEGATGVIHPLLNEAITQFQASAYKGDVAKWRPCPREYYWYAYSCDRATGSTCAGIHELPDNV